MMDSGASKVGPRGQAGPRPVDDLRLISAVPGRQRWEWSALAGVPARVRSLEDALGRQPEIIEARGNPITGRILIQYDRKIPSLRIGALLRSACAELQWDDGPFSVQVQPGAGSGSAVIGGLLLLGGTLCAASLAVSASLTSVPVLIGATSVVTALVAEPWLQVLVHREQDASVPSSLSSINRLLAYQAPKYQPRIILGSICSMISRILDLAPAVMTGIGLTVVTNGGNTFLSGMGLAGLMPQIVLLSGVTCVFWVLEAFSERAAIRVWNDLALDIQHDLRLELYDHVQRMETRYLEEDNIGRFSKVVSDDVNQIEYFYREGLHNLNEIATTIASVTAFFIFMAPSLAWVALLPIPIILYGTLFFHEKVGQLYEGAAREAGRLNAYVVGNMGGILTIRSFNSEAYELDRIRRSSGLYMEKKRDAVDVYSTYKASIRMAVLVGFVGTVSVGGIQVLAGELNLGVYALAQFLIQRFLWPFAYVGQVADQVEKTANAAVAVFEVLDTPCEQPGGTRGLRADQVRGDILFEDVTFHYEGRGPVLRDLSLHLPARRTSAIVGTTGVGKTTIAKLLLRFYDWSEGSILLDGQDLRTLRTRDLRDVISIVSQDSFLFDGTILENLAYGARDRAPGRVLEVARLAGVHEFVDKLPDGYESRVGERGVKLSGGQRQRICIARALLGDPPILILDEATSNVDNETEAMIQESLQLMSGHRTIVIIAHRLSTVRSAQQIYVLGEAGEILQRGTHEELVRSEGQYRSLWRIQIGEAASDHHE